MAVLTSFHSEKCRRLASKHEVSAGRLCSSVQQFLIYSIFVFVLQLEPLSIECLEFHVLRRTFDR